MATVIEEPRTPGSRRLLTAKDLAVLPKELPTGLVKYELDEGKLVTLMAPPGEIHGSNQATIIYILKTQGDCRGHGKTLCEVGVVLCRNPDTVVAPDAAFIVQRSLPVRTSDEGYLETIPELMVEIRSKNDSAAELHRKAALYLHAGARIVWLVDPASRIVTVCRVQQTPQELYEGDSLTAEGVIPGLQIPIAELFA